jgi:hypothetical protein
MTERPRDREGAAMNRLWKAEQAKLKAAQQNAMAEARNDVVVVEPPAVIHPTTQSGPAECENCTVKSSCRKVMKLWGNRAPRPAIVRAWVQLVDASGPDMVCLSQLRSEETPTTRFSLRSEK